MSSKWTLTEHVHHDSARPCGQCRHFIALGYRSSGLNLYGLSYHKTEGMIDECGRVGHSCAWERAHDINPSPAKEPNCGPEARYFEPAGKA